MLLIWYFLPFLIQFSKSIFVFSPSSTSTFKNYAVLSTEVNIDPYNRDEKCIFLDIYALMDNYRLCLLLNDIYSHRMLSDLSILTPNPSLGANIRKLNDFNTTFVRGYVVEKPYTSSLSGYIHNKSFYGKIQIDSRMFYIERLTKFKIVSKSYEKPEDKAIFYEAEDIDTNFLVEENDLSLMFEQTYNFTVGKIASRPMGYKMEDALEYWKGKSCTGMVILDYTFFKEIAESDINLAIMIFINSFLFVNNIFESTDFDQDGVPDDIGFIIKNLIIFDSVEMHNNNFKHETVHAVDASKYLDMFSKYENSYMTEACFELLETAQPFLSNILSISYVHPHTHLWLKDKPTVGICRKSPFNKLVITNYIDYGDYVPVLMTDLALVHEMGHMFGGVHDEGECYGYVMSSKLVEQSSKDIFYYTFSNCTKINIVKYLKSSGYCMQPWNIQNHCGNGLAEPGEECDCGLSHTCNTIHYCCIAHDGKDTPCKIDKKGGFDCVPNQGFCCNKECQYNDLTNYNINCESEDRRCPCEEANSFCRCGHSGICVGGYCHSQECVYSGLLECICPVMENKDCATCCIANTGDCVPLPQIKEVYINNSNPLLRDLKGVQFINYNKLAHMIWQKKGVCISFGKTGFCDNGVCDLIAPSIILNKMEQTVESLKPYYEEHMERHVPNRVHRQSPIQQMNEHLEDYPIPFLIDSSSGRNKPYFILVFLCIFIILK